MSSSVRRSIEPHTVVKLTRDGFDRIIMYERIPTMTVSEFLVLNSFLGFTPVEAQSLAIVFDIVVRERCVITSESTATVSSTTSQSLPDTKSNLPRFFIHQDTAQHGSAEDMDGLQELLGNNRETFYKVLGDLCFKRMIHCLVGDALTAFRVRAENQVSYQMHHEDSDDENNLLRFPVITGALTESGSTGIDDDDIEGGASENDDVDDVGTQETLPCYHRRIRQLRTQEGASGSGSSPPGVTTTETTATTTTTTADLGNPADNRTADDDDKESGSGSGAYWRMLVRTENFPIDISDALRKHLEAQVRFFMRRILQVVFRVYMHLPPDELREAMEESVAVAGAENILSTRLFGPPTCDFCATKDDVTTLRTCTLCHLSFDVCDTCTCALGDIICHRHFLSEQERRRRVAFLPQRVWRNRDDPSQTLDAAAKPAGAVAYEARSCDMLTGAMRTPTDQFLDVAARTVNFVLELRPDAVGGSYHVCWINPPDKFSRLVGPPPKVFVDVDAATFSELTRIQSGS